MLKQFRDAGFDYESLPPAEQARFDTQVAALEAQIAEQNSVLDEMPQPPRRRPQRKQGVRAMSGYGDFDPRRACGELPPEKQTQWTRAFQDAVELVQEAAAAVQLSPFSDSTPNDRRGDVDEHETNDCEHNIHACCALVRALMLLTDVRLGVDSWILAKLPGSPMSSHVTMDVQMAEYGRELAEPMMEHMCARHLVVMLCDALRFHYIMSERGMDRRIIHELEAQITRGSVDLSELAEEHPYTLPDGRTVPLYCCLTAADVEFCVAVMGVKINRAQ